MVQRLLADRFNLIVHVEKKRAQGRRLVLDRSDGRLGPSLRTSTIDCAADDAARLQRIAEGGDTAAPENQPGKCNITAVNGRVQAVGQTMDRFASFLSTAFRETIVDKTGLSGPFAIELHYAPYVPPHLQAEVDELKGDFGPPIEVALREQLGLRLEPTEIEVNNIVIDHVERPSAN
jgi:uncharacterized protein (TIGR03435 family)